MSRSSLNWVVIAIGGACVSLGLHLGLGVDFGWWGVLFWAGLGLVLGAVIAEIRA